MISVVKFSFLNYERRCGAVLLLIAVLTAVNLLLLWAEVAVRLYFSAAVPYYAAFFAHGLGGDGILRLLVGLFGVLGCLVYAACAVSTHPGQFGVMLYGLDTVGLLVTALLLVQNPICCLPELVAHGLVLVLLCPSYKKRRGCAHSDNPPVTALR